MARAKRNPPPTLSELEALVMDRVWAREAATTREVLGDLNSGAKQRAYTTVMTIMYRLEEKGLLKRKRRGKTDVYSATIAREDYANARVESEVGDLVKEYGDVALAHFARQVEKLDPKRARALRALARGE